MLTYLLLYFGGCVLAGFLIKWDVELEITNQQTEPWTRGLALICIVTSWIGIFAIILTIMFSKGSEIRQWLETPVKK